MDSNGKKMRITIIKKGPYSTTGNIPLYEKAIQRKGNSYELKEIRDIPHDHDYCLCRCGHSSQNPFCDGTHNKTGFIGKETASRDLYKNRAELLISKTIDLLDDYRCAFARFCHQPHGIVWELIKKSDNPELYNETIKGSNECPSGRLTVVEKSGKWIEPDYEPSIEIIQDPEMRVSAGIFVKGNILLESAEGFVYEIRSRIALCRCGRSNNMPFCDANHVRYKFADK